MILNSHPQENPSEELVTFLRRNIGLDEDAIKLGIRQSIIEQSPLPIVLWSFGLLTLSQYQEVLDYLHSSKRN